jgi:hypothetical protein
MGLVTIGVAEFLRIASIVLIVPESKWTYRWLRLDQSRLQLDCHELDRQPATFFQYQMNFEFSRTRVEG